MILYDEITMYKTTDGKIFEDEDEARVYALTKEAEAFGDDLKCYNYDMALIPLNQLALNADEIFYMNIKSEKAYEWISDFIADYCGYVVDGLTKAGIYVYDEDINIWINLDEKIKDLQELKEEIERG